MALCPDYCGCITYGEMLAEGYDLFRDFYYNKIEATPLLDEIIPQIIPMFNEYYFMRHPNGNYYGMNGHFFRKILNTVASSIEHELEILNANEQYLKTPSGRVSKVTGEFENNYSKSWVKDSPKDTPNLDTSQMGSGVNTDMTTTEIQASIDDINKLIDAARQPIDEFIKRFETMFQAIWE